MNRNESIHLGIDIGSTTVKIAILDETANEVLFSVMRGISLTFRKLFPICWGERYINLGPIHVSPVITGSGGLTLAKHLEVPFVQEVMAVSTAFRTMHLRQMLHRAWR